jgi:hypothetical protein
VKKVLVTVPVAAAFFAKASPVAKRLGIDVRQHLAPVMAEITLHQLAEEPHLWLTTVVFPSRKAAQKAVTAYFRGTNCAPHDRHERVTFMEGGRVRFERLSAPGAKAAERRFARLGAIYANASAEAARARKAIEKAAGLSAAV